MFQCIIQQRNGWARASPDLRDVFPDIRAQLSEQLRCLDCRLESQVSLVEELKDYFRRRAEVELDYSKNLEKLARTLQMRHKEQRQKREQWPLFSSYSCWQQLITQTKNLSKDHAVLSDIYSTHVVGRFTQVAEDVQRIYRRCREIGYETHEEILRVLHELHTTMKTYHSYQAECRQAETKLRVAEAQRLKLEQSLPKDKLDRSKKYRLIEKEVQKRKNKYNDAKLKALKARNEYVLCLEASNTTIHKYFVDDLSDLIDCMDFGFHNCISRALLMHVSAEETCARSLQVGLDQMTSSVGALDSRLDKQRFLEAHHSAFLIPKKFEFQGQRDEGADSELQKSLRDELDARLRQLQNRVTSLRTESEEVWKTLETAESTLLEMLDARDYDCTSYFNESTTSAAVATRQPEALSLKLRADRHETEEFYMTKFREYLMSTSRIARLDAKQEYLRGLLEKERSGDGSPTSLRSGTGAGPPGSGNGKPPRRKRIGRPQLGGHGQPKLFGGSLEEFLEATGHDIPLVLKSCIRVINLYGLHHQGIFRVSGSQVEINNFRDAFERGEDPLADVTDASDINSVAGVLKLYLRELREPLFPIIYFEHFMELAQLESKHEFVVKMRELVQSLPRSVVIVMRYLFAFLNHLSEFSDENMMDPYNLAICFGPTLVPVPEEKEQYQVQYQNQVNELIKNIILYHEDIFPLDGGPVYEKFISKEPDENDVGDSPSDHIPEDMDSEVYPSEDESECMEATAQFDFMARSDRELSFKKGDHLVLFSQVSNDWWRGSIDGREGLVPDKYILLKIRDEDREKLEGTGLRSSSSEESVRRRASASGSEGSVPSGSGSSPSPLAAVAPSAWPLPLADTPHQEIVNQVTPAGEEPQASEEESTETMVAADVRCQSPLPNVIQTPEMEEAGASDNGATQESPLAASSPSVPVAPSLSPPAVVNFSQSREIWRRRAEAASACSLTPKPTQAPSPVPSPSPVPTLRQKQTPDLVMDLPDKSPSPPDESNRSTGPESPDMTTAAERFAKQNQCTLKKNTKVSSVASACPAAGTQQQTDAQTQTQRARQAVSPATKPAPPPSKPQVKVKPQVLRKPVLPAAPVQPSPEPIRKDRPTSQEQHAAD
ncbi:SLIT-ROBO Rho GTPase-activating protein 1-like isoform X2 [Schistocerca gregaria]|uniref:SLIT-ROBO Rho GTPase-activating protein 1-like isoform X2 n=1 Tax=Schistocerca gregaria TaxID=7010 RepID=UPI00211EF4A4|nr:SLIT-ROBO Rho GTPase-activating protein 1-like isoform X2 [Schistocerca gregaria]